MEKRLSARTVLEVKCIKYLAWLWGCYPQPSEQKLGITLWPPIGRLASVV